MMEHYSKSYSKFAKKAKSYFQDDDNEEEDGPIEKLPPPDKQKINFVEQKAPKRSEWHKYFDIHLPEDIVQKKLKTEANSCSPFTMVEPMRSLSFSSPQFPFRKPNEAEECRPIDMLPRKISADQALHSSNAPNLQNKLLLGLLQNKLGGA